MARSSTPDLTRAADGVVDSYEFTVPGLPVAQPRQRTRVIPGGGTQNYTPTKHPVNAFKASVQRAWMDLVGSDKSPMSGPVRLELLFVMYRPAGMIWKKRPMPRSWHTSTPDDDNMEKAVRDALNKLAYMDDRQICSKRVRKVIASGSEMAHTKVRLLDYSNVPCEAEEE